MRSPYSCRDLMVVLGVALIATACMRHVRDVPAAPAPPVSLEAVLEELGRRREAVSAIKALLVIEVRRPVVPRSISLTGVLWIRPPGEVRLQGLDPLGRPLFDFLSRGESFQLYLPDRQLLLEGTPQALHGETPGPLQWMDLLEAAFAMAGHFIDVGEVAALERGEEQDILHLFYQQDGRAQLVSRLWLTRDRHLVARQELFNVEGAVRTVIRFGDFRETGSVWTPHRIVVEHGGNRLTLSVLEMHLNPSMGARDLALELPAGVEIRVLEGL